MHYINLNNYFRLQVCLYFRAWVHVFVRHTLRFYVVSQNVINKSSLVCVRSENYAFRVTLRLLGSIWQGNAEPINRRREAELRILELSWGS